MAALFEPYPNTAGTRGGVPNPKAAQAAAAWARDAAIDSRPSRRQSRAGRTGRLEELSVRHGKLLRGKSSSKSRYDRHQQPCAPCTSSPCKSQKQGQREAKGDLYLSRASGPPPAVTAWILRKVTGPPPQAAAAALAPSLIQGPLETQAIRLLCPLCSVTCAPNGSHHCNGRFCGAQPRRPAVLCWLCSVGY